MDILEKFRRKLDDLTVSDYYGLSSPGLTCYLNSVLQVLFMTKDFCEAVERCCKKEASLLDQHLCQLFADLRKTFVSPQCTSSVTLQSILRRSCA